MSCSDWVQSIDTLLNQFSVLIPILVASLIIRIVRILFR